MLANGRKQSVFERFAEQTLEFQGNAFALWFLVCYSPYAVGL